jgi:hypothetical protein
MGYLWSLFARFLPSHFRHPLDKMTEKLSVEECRAHIRDIHNSHGADARNESERFLRRGYEGMLKL